ncbi:uncharacterized protein FFB20_04891 [Fusarium fujikuroi]|nr:uncharacterized protein FFB20_04891 [Fusarium fujikuroi]SCN76552.1 uncharacterized protein FFE2_03545 [Fusarium fujikuroi]SCN78454.1 uncharacterized protein FFM5_01866 [Fusarium fujikuroi]SCN94766.1 uncharacterized protein FFC1_07124 [Fusarium fujikuroi]SCO33770.1 uncharacterized protein FFMR_03223 [Fusarium fujikuroi]
MPGIPGQQRAAFPWALPRLVQCLSLVLILLVGARTHQARRVLRGEMSGFLS